MGHLGANHHGSHVQSRASEDLTYSRPALSKEGRDEKGEQETLRVHVKFVVAWCASALSFRYRSVAKREMMCTGTKSASEETIKWFRVDDSFWTFSVSTTERIRPDWVELRRELYVTETEEMRVREAQVPVSVHIGPESSSDVQCSCMLASRARTVRQRSSHAQRGATLFSTDVDSGVECMCAEHCERNHCAQDGVIHCHTVVPSSVGEQQEPGLSLTKGGLRAYLRRGVKHGCARHLCMPAKPFRLVLSVFPDLAKRAPPL